MNEIEKLVKEKAKIQKQLNSLTLDNLELIDPVLWETDIYSGDTEDRLNGYKTHQEIRDYTTEWEIYGEYIKFEWAEYYHGYYEYGGSFKVKMEYLLNEEARKEETDRRKAKLLEEEYKRQKETEAREEAEKAAQLQADKDKLEALLKRRENGEL